MRISLSYILIMNDGVLKALLYFHWSLLILHNSFYLDWFNTKSEKRKCFCRILLHTCERHLNSDPKMTLAYQNSVSQLFSTQSNQADLKINCTSSCPRTSPYHQRTSLAINGSCTSFLFCRTT